MLWVISGCAIGLPAFIFAEIAQSASLLNLFGMSLSSVGIGLLHLLNGVLVHFISVAVLRRRVISVSIPLRHGTILTVLSLAVGIPIVDLHELLSHRQDGAPIIPEWVWVLVVAPVALVLLQRLHGIGVKLVDRLLNRRFHAARREMKIAAAATLKARDFGAVDRLLASVPTRALRLSYGAVFRQQDGVYRRREAIGWHASDLRERRPAHDAAVLRSVETGAVAAFAGLRQEVSDLRTRLGAVQWAPA